MNEKTIKIVEDQVLNFLKQQKEPKFTYKIAESLGRDDEFIKRILENLSCKNLVRMISDTNIKKSRRKWEVINGP